jgi:hypothetical protein
MALLLRPLNLWYWTGRENRPNQRDIEGFASRKVSCKQVTRVIEIQNDRSMTSGERERRVKRRFQIEQDVRYKMLYGQRIAETGTGRTVNISSGGVWFTTDSMLATGMPIELSMSWPVLLNDSCAMKLMIYGCVVRSNEKGAAVAIERYEFRTTGRPLQPQVAHSGTEFRLHN